MMHSYRSPARDLLPLVHNPVDGGLPRFARKAERPGLIAKWDVVNNKLVCRWVLQEK